MTIKTTLTALAVAGAMSTGAAMAQNTNIDAGGGKGLVVVDISNVATDIANDLSVTDAVDVNDVLDVGSVQVPINLAAAVCELEVNAIANSNDKGTKSCDATTTNDSLNQAVQRSLNTSG